MMILTGSLAMVMTNRDNAGPYAVNAQPKNAKTVILESLTLSYISNFIKFSEESEVLIC